MKSFIDFIKYFILILLFIPSFVFAATFTVSSTADGGPGSLRQAILQANSDAALDRIEFAIPPSDPGCIAMMGKAAPVCVINVGSSIHTYNLPLRNFCSLNVTASSAVGSVVGNCTVVAKTPYMGTPPIGYIEAIKDSGGNDYQIKMGESLPHLTSPVVIDGFSQAKYMGLANDEVLIELRGDNMQLRSNARFYPDSTGMQDLRVPVMRVVVVDPADTDPKAFTCGTMKCKLVQNGTTTTNIDIPTEEESGIFIRTKDSTIQGLAINRFGFPFATGGANGLGAGGVGILVTGAGNVDPAAPITDATIGTNNQIVKNYIGTDATGKMPNTFASGACVRPACLGNAWNGIILNGASNNFVKGNVMANSGRSGKSTESFGRDMQIPNNNHVIGNFVGISDDGLTKVGNNVDGIFINGANNIIGCTDNPYDPIKGCSDPAEANMVAGNGNAAAIFNAAAGGVTVTHNNRVLGNIIGLDKNGNILKNIKMAGIVIRGSNNLVQGNTIGGNGFGGLNIVALNRLLAYSPTQFNRIEYNKIGLNQFGNAASNDQFGIALTSTSNNNLIAYNQIAHNERGGIMLVTFNGDTFGNSIFLPNSVPRGNSILYNAIYNNGGLGIDLVGNVDVIANPANPQPFPIDGPTVNDVLDIDANKPNNLQNHPILNAQRSFINPALVQVHGSLDSKANSSYLIQVFSSELADPLGYGEGQVFIGEMLVLTDGSGHVNFHLPAMANIPVGSIITATATDLATGDTSEFSPWINVDMKASPTAYEYANGAAGGDASNNSSDIEPASICLDPNSSAFLTGSCE